MKLFNDQPQAKQRRRNVITRLEEQLAKGTKSFKDETQPLTENDIKRIKHELATLKTRIS